MSFLEFALAFVGHLTGLFRFTSFIFLFASVIALFLFAHEYEQYEQKQTWKDSPAQRTKKWMVISLLLCFGFGVLSCIPDADDLWKVRIALVKINLASPENVTAGVKRIDEISKKLECKYLGCEPEPVKK